MVINNAKFIISAADKNGFYDDSRPLIAVAGKSNVGKSSFINMLAQNRKLAKTSSLPGRTRLINYFDMGKFILCDLPGYGYANAAKTEKQKWSTLANDFFDYSINLKCVIMLVDIRHNATELDIALCSYLYAKNIPFVIFATKSDKIPKSKINIHIKNIAAQLKVGQDNILPVSNINNFGREKALAVIESYLNR